MKVAIMQPYFFPYIGYFQLMHAVELFIVYDDAQYMKGGWINRNLICVDDEPRWLTLPVCKGHIEEPINRRRYRFEDRDFVSLKRMIRAAYGQLPGYLEAGPFVENMLDYPGKNVASFNTHLLESLGRFLGIPCEFALSSKLGSPTSLRGEERVIDLCRRAGASDYINPIGGAHLYSADRFARDGIDLSFVQTRCATVQLSTGPRHLSIIDPLLRNGSTFVRDKLVEYELVRANGGRA